MNCKSYIILITVKSQKGHEFWKSMSFGKEEQQYY